MIFGSDQQNRKPLVVLTGPTAVGKTELSVRLAARIGGEILSADSMQVYRGMDIGSAKVTQKEMQGIPHHLIDILEPDEEFHVVQFKERALKCIEEIHKAGKIPILVGGTGFYIQAVLYDIDFTDAGSDSARRAKLEQLAKERGPEYLHGMLREADPASAEKIHANNIRRVIRALEFYQETGEKISEHNETQRKKDSPYHFAYFVLNDERDLLYEKIGQRVDRMMEQGLLEEVMRLRAKGYDRSMVSMQGLGYKEMLAYLEGEISLDEAVRILKRDTRHFAKRQLTWFRREKDVIWVNKGEFGYDDEKILRYLTGILQEKKILK